MKLPFGLNGKLARTGLALKNNAPELCVAGSIALGTGCVVTACIATVKAHPVVKQNNEKIHVILKGRDGESSEIRKMNELNKNEKKEVMDIRRNTAMTIIKHYSIPAALGLGSIALNISGNRILRRNLTAMTVAYAGLLKSYNKYRQRVISELGKEKDQEFMYGTKKRKCVDIDPDTGEVKSEKEEFVQENECISQYARFFDEGEWDDINNRWVWRNPRYKDDNFLNQKTLRSVEREANQKLVLDGFLFLNDVYRMLGLPLSIDGQIVGWSYTGQGDHGISFGVFDDDPRQLPINREFTEGKRNTALLDFNVDGPIINELENFFGKDMTMKLIAQRM